MSNLKKNNFVITHQYKKKKKHEETQHDYLFSGTSSKIIQELEEKYKALKEKEKISNNSSLNIYYSPKPVMKYKVINNSNEKRANNLSSSINTINTSVIIVKPQKEMITVNKFCFSPKAESTSQYINNDKPKNYSGSKVQSLSESNSFKLKGSLNDKFKKCSINNKNILPSNSNGFKFNSPKFSDRNKEKNNGDRATSATPKQDKKNNKLIGKFNFLNSNDKCIHNHLTHFTTNEKGNGTSNSHNEPLIYQKPSCNNSEKLSKVTSNLILHLRPNKNQYKLIKSKYKYIKDKPIKTTTKNQLKAISRLFNYQTKTEPNSFESNQRTVRINKLKLH